MVGWQLSVIVPALVNVCVNCRATVWRAEPVPTIVAEVSSSAGLFASRKQMT